MSNAAHWEQLYDQAYTRGMERISQINGVACAFHSVIDGFIRLTPDLLRPVLERDSTLKQAALAGCKGEPPLEILSPQDFIRFYRGSAPAYDSFKQRIKSLIPSVAVSYVWVEPRQ